MNQRRSVQPSRRASVCSELNPLDTSAQYQPYPLTRFELQRLNSRFSELCNHIDEEEDTVGENLYFNFITWEAEKNKKIKFDPQVVSSRLKQVENKLEISRANMQLDKRHTPHRRIRPPEHIAYSPDYKEFFEKGLHKRPAFEEIPQNRDESNDQSDEPAAKDNDPSILHYHELKHRPKFLGYLQKRVHSPSKTVAPYTTRQSGYYKEMQYERALKKLEKNRQGANPEQIIEKQYPKFFNRGNDSNLSSEVREKPICRNIISVHEQIIDNSPDISDENRRKLQEKLNHIVKEIARGDRHDPNRKRTTRLPRLTQHEIL